MIDIRVGTVALLCACMLSPSPARGQQAASRLVVTTGIAVMGVVASPRSGVVFNEALEGGSGSWKGVGTAIRLGILVIEGSAIGGILAPDQEVGVTRDAGEVRGLGRLEVAPSYFAFEGGVTYRVFDSVYGYQKWLIPSAGVWISVPLGTDMFRAFIRGAYHPAVTVSGLEQPRIAVSGEAGLRIQTPFVPFIVDVRYRVERFDFTDTLPQRLEHFDILQFGIGLGLGTV